MASFDPREWMKKDEPVMAAKLPLQRLEPTLRKFIQVAIPTDLERLRRHQVNIERHVHTKCWKDLNVEQINASRTVQQLKANMRELENTRLQIRSEDHAAFEAKIAPTKQQAIESINSFGDLQSNLAERFGSNQSNSSPDNEIAFPKTSPNGSNQLQTQARADEVAASASWDELRESLVDLSCIIHQFSDLVTEQQEKVDSISENIDKSHNYVREAAVQLGQASKLKAAMIPIAGAVVGGLVGGPIGLLAGFKLAGVAAAVGGGVVGYQGGKIIKNKRDEKITRQLDNLSEQSIPLKAIKDKAA